MFLRLDLGTLPSTRLSDSFLHSHWSFPFSGHEIEQEPTALTQPETSLPLLLDNPAEGREVKRLGSKEMHSGAPRNKEEKADKYHKDESSGRDAEDALRKLEELEVRSLKMGSP